MWRFWSVAGGEGVKEEGRGVSGRGRCGTGLRWWLVFPSSLRFMVGVAAVSPAGPASSAGRTGAGVAAGRLVLLP